MNGLDSDFQRIFVDDLPLLDVRAPVEFSKGAFPTATNIPLLDDSQREQIGIRYKEAGEEEAIRLGLELATDDIRARRISSWLEHCQSNPKGYLYCFRGGLRSRTTQQWIKEQGTDYPLIPGGYKAMRRYLIEQLELNSQNLPMVCVSGLTGVGKTRVLTRLSRHVDFEGLAQHRGSAFGSNTTDTQPGVIDWENAVSIELIKHRHQHPGRSVFVEDEGRRIGRVNMPNCLCEALLKAPRAILQSDLESRMALISEDYIVNAWPSYQEQYGEIAESKFSEFILQNLSRIQKRLGGERYKKVRQCFEYALAEFFRNGSVEDFGPGIKILLEDYYDPMYRYQIETKKPEIIFEGPESEFKEWADAFH